MIAAFKIWGLLSMGALALWLCLPARADVGEAAGECDPISKICSFAPRADGADDAISNPAGPTEGGNGSNG